MTLPRKEKPVKAPTTDTTATVQAANEDQKPDINA